MKKLYFAFDHRNLDWKPDEVDDFDTMIKNGYDIPEIAKVLKRCVAETLLLYLDRVDKGEIPHRYTLRKI